MRTFNQAISKNTVQCQACGLVKNHCLCDYDIKLNSQAEFWLLTHENEFTRTNNTGRLLENAFSTCKVFRWHRKEVPEDLVNLLEDYDTYLVFAADSEEDKKRQVNYKKSEKKTAFLILDGTWKEVRKMIRKSDYLRPLKLLSLEPDKITDYKLRRNNDANHICTVEVGIELLKLIGEDNQASALKTYFDFFIDRYNAGRYEHEEVKND